MFSCPSPKLPIDPCLGSICLLILRNPTCNQLISQLPKKQITNQNSFFLKGQTQNVIFFNLVFSWISFTKGKVFYYSCLPLKRSLMTPPMPCVEQQHISTPPCFTIPIYLFQPQNSLPLDHIHLHQIRSSVKWNAHTIVLHISHQPPILI